MPIENNSTLKYNHGEKSLKAPSTIYAGLECLLVKQQSSKLILMILILKKRPCMDLVATHQIQLVHMIQNKTNNDFIEEETVLKNFVKI